MLKERAKRIKPPIYLQAFLFQRAVTLQMHPWCAQLWHPERQRRNPAWELEKCKKKCNLPFSVSRCFLESKLALVAVLWKGAKKMTLCRVQTLPQAWGLALQKVLFLPPAPSSDGLLPQPAPTSPLQAPKKILQVAVLPPESLYSPLL